eukprot:GGOE01022396.1.p1 GENE.GGOE01022396.1~~GGOE01022396.1.p1  ORF type:complete len:143 (-),score=6.86 GGOE01022396.1:75-473(-)
MGAAAPWLFFGAALLCLLLWVFHSKISPPAAVAGSVSGASSTSRIPMQPVVDADKMAKLENSSTVARQGAPVIARKPAILLKSGMARSNASLASQFGVSQLEETLRSHFKQVASPRHLHTFCLGMTWWRSMY